LTLQRALRQTVVAAEFGQLQSSCFEFNHKPKDLFTASELLRIYQVASLTVSNSISKSYGHA
jgi:hypothetical protein